MSEHVQTHTGGEEIRDISRLRAMLPVLIGIGVIAIGVAAVLGRGDPKQLGMAYLTGYAAFLTVSMGALFFVIIHHLTRAGWSVTVRRLAEVMAVNTATMVLLAIPIFFGVETIYHWAHPQGDAVLLEKAGWLNPPFWILRITFYLLICTGMAAWFWRHSLRQDRTGETYITEKLQHYSGFCVVVFALTINFAALDLIMSLDPHWTSTMLGVIVFAGAFLNFFAMSIVLFRFRQARGLLTRSVTVEHYHDMGKFMFAFVFFWGYVGYSQYMLIWYANIPEETQWFAKRGMTTDDVWRAGPWGAVALLLVFGHLFFPFAALLSRKAKRGLPILTALAGWMLFMHFVDMFWLIMPEVTPDPNEVGEPGIGQSLLLAALCWVGVGAIWLAGVIGFASVGSLVPTRDPRIHEALAHEVY